jgi:F-type H+-transporting ATPase subunit b
MTTLLEQLGGLVLGSVPTMVLFLITVAAYRLLVHSPLKKVLKQRYDRTQGAIENANQAIAAAEAKTAEYEDRLRAARAAIFHERHARLQNVHKESELALTEARAAAQEKVANAIIAIEESAQVARLQLDNTIGELTQEVLRAVLPPGAAPQEQAG